MALEDAIKDLTAALNKNTAALGGGAAPKAGAKADPAPAKNAVTIEAVKAACKAVADKFGRPAAVKLIKQHGKAAEIAAVKPSLWKALLDAAKEKMAEGDDDGEEEEVAEEEDGL